MHVVSGHQVPQHLAGELAAVSARACAGDRDLGGFGVFGERDAQRENAGGVAGLHPVGVRGVAQNHLPPERLGSLWRPIGTLSPARLATHRAALIHAPMAGCAPTDTRPDPRTHQPELTHRVRAVCWTDNRARMPASARRPRSNRKSPAVRLMICEGNCDDRSCHVTVGRVRRVFRGR